MTDWFYALSLVKSLGFPKWTPELVTHHTHIELALVTLLKSHHILVEVLTMLFEVDFNIGFKQIHIGVFYVQFQRHLLVELKKIVDESEVVFLFLFTPNGLNNHSKLRRQRLSGELWVLY